MEHDKIKSEQLYTELLYNLDDEMQERLDDLEDLSVRAHKLSVRKETERLEHLQMIQERDIRIRILEDSYQMVISSKWWKLTNGIRRIYEFVQKRILHKKTMTEMLQEIADPGRYDRIDYESQKKDIYKNSLREFAEGEKAGWNVLTKDYRDGEVIDATVSVVIPTYNGGAGFRGVLAALKGQVGVKKVEIIAVDSGSLDETLENCALFGVDVIQISQEEFSHSYARNLGAKKASGEYLLFMTQDAEPTDKAWLYRMLSVMKEQDVVALSPKEKSNHRGDLKYCADSRYHSIYLGLSSGDRICEYKEGMSADELRKNAQLTDVSCLIKKEVFNRYQYTGDYAEDLRLGVALIQDGFKLAQLASVEVRHGHDRSAEYIRERSYVDRKALCEIFPEMLTESMTKEELVHNIKVGEEAMREALDAMNQLSQYYTNIIVYGRQLEYCLMHAAEGKDLRIIGMVQNYVRMVLMPYIADGHAFISDSLHKDIKEAIYKSFSSEVGIWLANYCKMYDDYPSEIELINEKRI